MPQWSDDRSKTSISWLFKVNVNKVVATTRSNYGNLKILSLSWILDVHFEFARISVFCCVLKIGKKLGADYIFHVEDT